MKYLKKVLFFLLGFLLYPFSSNALEPIYDWSTQLVTRSVPLGLSLSALGGAGFKIWQDSDSSSSLSPYMYGFIRPQLRVNSSGLVNSGEVKLDIFPISFVGLSLGQIFSHRNLSPSNVDCVQILCSGRVNRKYLQAKIGLAHSGWSGFTLIRYEDTQVKSDSSLNYFYEESSSLVGLKFGDQIQNFEATLLRDLSEKLKLGYFFSGYKMKGTWERSKLHAALLVFEKSNLSILSGLGVYDSSIKPSSFTVFAGIKLSSDGSLVLF